MTRPLAAWFMMLFALLAAMVGYIAPGAVPFLDLPILSLAALALTALATLDAETLRRVAGWRLTRAFAVFLAWALLSSLASGRFHASLFGNPGNGLGLLAAIAFASVVILVASRARSVRDVLMTAAPWVLLGESAVAVNQIRVGLWPGGTLSNPSYFVMIMGLLLPIASVARDGESVSSRRLRWFSVAAGLVVVALNGSRAGFIAVAVWLAVSLWTGGLVESLAVKWRRIALAIVAAAAVPAAAYTYRVGGAGLEETVADRLSRTMAAWYGLLERPLLGWGPDGFTTGAASHIPVSLLGQSSSDFGQFGADPHNILAWIGVSLGFPGLLLAGYLCFEAIRNWRLQATAGRLSRPFVWAVALYAFQVLFAPAALQTVPLMALVLGASFDVERPSARVRTVAGGGLRSRAALSGWLLVFVMGFSAFTLGAYGVTRIATGELPSTADPVPLERAARIWNDPYLWYRASLAWGFASSRDPEASPPGRSLELVNRVVELEADNPVYLTERARAIAYYGTNRAEADRAFEAVYAIFPLSPDARSSHAQYLLALKDTEAARAVLEPIAAAEVPAVWEAWVSYYDALGDPEQAAAYRELLSRPRMREGRE